MHLNDSYDKDARGDRAANGSRSGLNIAMRMAVVAGIVAAVVAIPNPSETELRQQYEKLSPQARHEVDESIIRRTDLSAEQMTELNQLRACVDAAPACVLTVEQLAELHKLEDIQLSQELKRFRSEQRTFDPLE
jgi:hypothetical protein